MRWKEALVSLPSFCRKSQKYQGKPQAKGTRVLHAREKDHAGKRND